jgi:rRNA maturation protein Nop10
MRSGQGGSEVLLSFDPVALERCYLVADILHDEFAESFVEYGLIGLADQTEPFHVVATPLLVGQSVTAASVEQPGRQVLRMRDEMESLAHRMQRTLVPIAFIHRHPSSCDASTTDEVFLHGVFVDQVSTVVSFEEIRPVDEVDPPCSCPGVHRLLRNSPSERGGAIELRSEYAIAFSLIVNRERDHRIYAVRRAICPFCGESALVEVPARIAPDSRFPVSGPDREALRGPLAREIREKIRFDRERTEVEGVR